MEDNRRRGDGGTAAVKKKRRTKRRRDPRKGPPAARGPPPPPVLKVTIRNIYNGNVVEIIRTLISSANEKLTGLDPKMVLDEDHLQKLISDQKAALEADEKWKSEKNHAAVSTGDLKLDEEKATSTQSSETTTGMAVDRIINAAVDRNQRISSKANGCIVQAAGSTVKRHPTTICARVLYMVAPKKTHRRGEKPGVAYLLLTAPPMETTTLTPVVEPIPPRTNTTSSSEGAVASKSDETVVSQNSGAPTYAAPPTGVDSTRDVAKRRLMLQNALYALQEIASTEASNNVDAIVVEESIHGKIWKQATVAGTRPSPLDRMVGTIFDTDDYKQYLERTAKEEELRLARPKPAPGGGVVHTNSGTAENSAQQPVAALVLHLQQKQEDEKMRKLAKRSTKETKTKKSSTAAEKTNGVVVKDGSNAGKGGKGGAGSRQPGRKRLRRPKKMIPPAVGHGTKPHAVKPS